VYYQAVQEVLSLMPFVEIACLFCLVLLIEMVEVFGVGPIWDKRTLQLWNICTDPTSHQQFCWA
jgi:hypothetical protein